MAVTQTEWAKLGFEEALPTLKTSRLIVSVFGREKQGKCLTGNTKITLDTGERIDVSSLRQGMRIPSITTLGRPKLVTVTKVSCDGILPTLNIKLADGRKISTTREHKFFSCRPPKGGWKRHPRGVSDWVDAERLQIGDYVLAPSKLEIDPRKEVSPELAKVIAYLLSDGSLSSSSARFTQVEDEIRTEFCDAAMSLGFQIANYTYGQKAATVGVSSGMSRSHWGGRSPFKDFRDEWGLFGNAAEKKIPGDIFKWGKGSLQIFLSRYFTCDGWISKNRTGFEVGVCSASEDIVRSISHLLLRFGIPGSVRSREVSSRTYFVWETRTAGALEFIRSIGFFGSKKVKARNLYSQVLKTKRYGRLGPLLFPNGMWVKVTSIDSGLSLPVYDIEVDKEHSFTANDILVHNTHFALTAPGPIAYLSFDYGDEGVVEKFVADGKKIYRMDYRLPVDSKTPYPEVEAKAASLYAKFNKDYQFCLSNARTVIIDTDTERHEMLQLSNFGKLSQNNKYAYGPINIEVREMLRKAYDSKCNLILLQKMKPEYINDKQTGNYKRAGWGDMGFNTQVNVHCFRDREDGEFKIRVEDCRQNATLAGEVYGPPMNSFPWLAVNIFPDTSLDDWEA